MRLLGKACQGSYSSWKLPQLNAANQYVDVSRSTPGKNAAVANQTVATWRKLLRSDRQATDCAIRFKERCKCHFLIFLHPDGGR